MHCAYKTLIVSLLSLCLSVLTCQFAQARNVTIVSDGRDFSDRLLAAVEVNDTVFLDGGNGVFVLHHTVVLKHLKDKALIGLNEACLQTEFRLTDEIKSALDSMGIRGMSTAGKGGVLSNGMRVREEREWRTRQYLIDLYDDQHEHCRSAGGLQVSHCRNMLIKGLRIQGPGAVDVGGNDLIGMDHSTHIRIEDCHLRDGMDGNMDIIAQSDSIWVSRCTFGYTELSYDHMNSNLVGAGDGFEADRGLLHVTYEDCTWLEGCRQRMPMARYGVVRLIRCKWLCTSDFPAVDARKEAKISIEDGLFGEGIKVPFRVAEDARCDTINCRFF